ncbi:protein phosphatase 2C domain-containing protein [Amycolatopsis ultiminotia]|uniref:protein phosphatase 2C domain-containing protein n=1 Tax=Amycolatopsis ultiminotia TaxID=543629 RepID=UPI0031EFB37E
MADDQIALVLDGASAFEPVDVSTSTYVNHLANEISANLKEGPEVALAESVAAAIEETARELDLKAGNAPSSTVSLLRERDDSVDIFCLGDSAIYYGADDGEPIELIDLRLANLGITQHRAYRERIAAGHGYDARHRELLSELQREQRKCRNRPGGYWIAETDPDAARHGYTRTVPRKDITWAVLATDGAYGPMLHLGLANWALLARQPAPTLERTLAECARWEHEVDPDGRLLPRAKVSDDKALACAVL